MWICNFERIVHLYLRSNTSLFIGIHRLSDTCSVLLFPVFPDYQMSQSMALLWRQTFCCYDSVNHSQGTPDSEAPNG